MIILEIFSFKSVMCFFQRGIKYERPGFMFTGVPGEHQAWHECRRWGHSAEPERSHRDSKRPPAGLGLWALLLRATHQEGACPSPALNSCQAPSSCSSLSHGPGTGCLHPHRHPYVYSQHLFLDDPWTSNTQHSQNQVPPTLSRGESPLATYPKARAQDAPPTPASSFSGVLNPVLPPSKTTHPLRSTPPPMISSDHPPYQEPSPTPRRAASTEWHPQGTSGHGALTAVMASTRPWGKHQVRHSLNRPWQANPSSSCFCLL